MLKKILQRIKEYIDKYVLKNKYGIDPEEETNFILYTFSKIFEEQYVDTIMIEENKPIYLGFSNLNSKLFNKFKFNQ